MKRIYDVAAPAKLNLFLHITDRLDNGYHALQSVFMLIDWCDYLQFELRNDGKISREDLNSSHKLTLPAHDLCIRAAQALKNKSSHAHGVHIGLHKNIPSQAGMGGGSSDAASCLLALNQLWQLHLPLSALMQIGLSLGADVPFFLRGHHAWVEGIGEKITPLTEDAQLPPAKFLVIKPSAGLDTGEIFSSLNFSENSKKAATIADFAAKHYDFGRNDLQPIAQKLCPDVEKVIKWLANKGLQGRMTGSGSAVFAKLEHSIDLLDAPTGWQLKECCNLNTHPLLGWAFDKDNG